MSHSLSSVSATAAALSRPSRLLQPRCNPHNFLISRRNFSLVLTGAMLGLNVADRSAEAAARRPPPPPPQEKKEPNVSGVQAKVLASKKRKGAMKEAVAKLREKGKAIDQTPPN